MWYVYQILNSRTKKFKEWIALQNLNKQTIETKD